MTGTIVGLAGSVRTGTIRSREGSRLTFSAADVLGDYDTLAIGHLVSFDLDRVPPGHTAVRVFREPCGGARTPGKKADAPPDLRYAGFSQAGSIRSCGFDAVASGHPVQHFTVTVDLALLRKHRIGVQEAPALCLRKLAADLKVLPDQGPHELGDADLAAYVSSRAAVVERRRPRHSFAVRRGSPPPGPPGHVQASGAPVLAPRGSR